nr:hypothetical protein [Tanacetum cinerariifolium]
MVPEEDPKEVIPHVVAAPPESPITPPSLSESFSDYEFIAPVTSNGTLWVPPPGSKFNVRGPSFVSVPPSHLLGREVKRLREDTKSLYGSVRTLEWGMRTCQTESDDTRTGVDREGRARYQEKIRKLERLVDALEVSNTLMAMDKDMIKRYFFSMLVWLSEFMRWGAIEACPRKSIDVLAVYGDAKHSEPHGPPDGPKVEGILLKIYREFFQEITKPLTLLTQKNKKYEWDGKQKEAFRILKVKLCNAPMLALPDRPHDFVELDMRQRHWIEFYRDYDCEIRYHLGKVNVVADSLSRRTLKKVLGTQLDMSMAYYPQTDGQKEPVEIVDREVKKLKRRRILIVKVRWNSKRGAKFTWEREENFKS